ncbi:hypothetical protein [Glycomyces tarimensis]
MTDHDHRLFAAMTVILVGFSTFCALAAAQLDTLGASTIASLVLAGIAVAVGAGAVALACWWRAESAAGDESDARCERRGQSRRATTVTFPEPMDAWAPPTPPMRPEPLFRAASAGERMWSVTGQFARAGGERSWPASY